MVCQEQSYLEEPGAAQKSARLRPPVREHIIQRAEVPYARTLEPRMNDISISE